MLLRIVDLYLYLSVLHPEEWLRKILKFLDLPWNDNVLKHHEQINKKGKTNLFLEQGNRVREPEPPRRLLLFVRGNNVIFKVEGR